jgi:hypothetical protein
VRCGPTGDPLDEPVAAWCEQREAWNPNRRSRNVPFTNVKVIEGASPAEQKPRIIRKLTDAMVEIEGEAMRPMT